MPWKLGGNWEPSKMICEKFGWEKCVVALSKYVWTELVTDVVDFLLSDILLLRKVVIVSLCLFIIGLCIDQAIQWRALVRSNKKYIDRADGKIQDLDLKVSILTFKAHYGFWPWISRKEPQLMVQSTGTETEDEVIYMRKPLASTREENSKSEIQTEKEEVSMDDSETSKTDSDESKVKPKLTSSEEQGFSSSTSNHDSLFEVKERLENLHTTLKDFNPKKIRNSDDFKSKISCNPMFKDFDSISCANLPENDSEDQNMSNLTMKFDNLSLNEIVEDSIKYVRDITENFTKGQTEAITEAKELIAKQIEKSFSEEERAVELEMANEKLEKLESSTTFTKIFDDRDIDQESFPENFKDNLSGAEDKILKKRRSTLPRKNKISSQSCNDLDKSTCSSFSGSSLPVAQSKRQSRPSSSSCTSRKSFYNLVPSSGYNPQLKGCTLQGKRSRSLATTSKRKVETDQSSKSSSKSCLLDPPKFSAKSSIPILISETRPKSPARGPLTMKSGDPLSLGEKISSKECGDNVQDSKLEVLQATEKGLDIESPKLN